MVCVPLNLWFASAYRNKTDLWDRHYHEFEDWQFDWLLEKAGWHKKTVNLPIRLKKLESAILKIIHTTLLFGICRA